MREKQRRALWSELAGEIGGTHHIPKGIFSRGGNERIEVTLRDVPLVLDTYAISTGKVTQVFTRVSADYRFGPGPKVRVYKEGWLQRVGKALGMQDVPIGNAAFDAKFMVKTDSPAVARRLWTDVAMRKMLELPGAFFKSTPESAIVIETGKWADKAKMRNALDMIAELANHDLYGIAALREVGTIVQERGEWPRAELDTGVRVVVGAEDRDGKLVMAAHTLDLIQVATIQIVDGSFSGVELPQAAHVHARNAGSGTLSTDGFVWTDLELDPARLRAGAELLGAIAASRTGVYR